MSAKVSTYLCLISIALSLLVLAVWASRAHGQPASKPALQNPVSKPVIKIGTAYRAEMRPVRMPKANKLKGPARGR